MLKFAPFALLLCAMSVYVYCDPQTENHHLKPPKAINICGKKMPIVLVHYIAPIKGFEVNGPVFGYTHDDRIELLDTRPDGEMAVTLSHEIMHVILTTDVSNDDSTVHDFIKKLSPCYIDTIFHSNPELLVYFIGAGYHMKLEKDEMLNGKDKQ